MGVADNLEQAAQLIAERGLCKGNYTDETGALCVYGAINAVKGRRFDEIVSLEPEDVAVARIAGCDPAEIAEWNDNALRTQAEVVFTLRAAAAIARGEEPSK